MTQAPRFRWDGARRPVHPVNDRGGSARARIDTGTELVAVVYRWTRPRADPAGESPGRTHKVRGLHWRWARIHP